MKNSLLRKSLTMATSEVKQASTDPQPPIHRKRMAVTGYIRGIQQQLPFHENTFFNIPPSIGEVVLRYYPSGM